MCVKQNILIKKRRAGHECTLWRRCGDNGDGSAARARASYTARVASRKAILTTMFNTTRPLMRQHCKLLGRLGSSFVCVCVCVCMDMCVYGYVCVCVCVCMDMCCWG